jgi:hypothetical protein
VIKGEPSQKLPRIIPVLILLVTAYFSAGSYLIASRLIHSYGFPLDDAWIHQCFARNLFYYGEWAFQHGFPTAGSTSPLWSVLLVPSFLFRLNPILWSFLINGFFLFLVGVFGQLLFNINSPTITFRIPWIGILLITEWHMVWAAGSGMEIVLFSLLCLSVFYLLSKNKENYWVTGLLTGLALWTRPEGVTLIGPILLILMTRKISVKEKIKNSATIIGIVATFLFLSLLFNYALSEKLFSNTFFAKQAEYASLLNASIIIRYLRLLYLPLIGSGVLLIPGFLYLTYDSIRKRDWKIIAFILWIFGFIFVYTLLLPVMYQHGRYIMPVIPLLLVLSTLGVLRVLSKVTGLIARIIKKTWVISIGVTAIAFFILGAISFGNDVGFIETEMMATAMWVNNNIPSDAILAAHDIGALGYFADQKIVDLAGLVSPEVIAFIRDENRIATYLDELNVGYLVTFPDWYPYLVERSQVIFISNGNFSGKFGGTNMEVLLWRSK